MQSLPTKKQRNTLNTEFTSERYPENWQLQICRLYREEWKSVPFLFSESIAVPGAQCGCTSQLRRDPLGAKLGPSWPKVAQKEPKLRWANICNTKTTNIYKTHYTYVIHWKIIDTIQYLSSIRLTVLFWLLHVKCSNVKYIDHSPE